MAGHDAPNSASTQLMLPFLMGKTHREGDIPVGEPDDCVRALAEPELEEEAVPDSEEIPAEWLKVMPELWRGRLLARAELTGVMNLWTLSAVTGVPTWRLRARLEEACMRWREFSRSVDDLARRATERQEATIVETGALPRRAG